MADTVLERRLPLDGADLPRSKHFSVAVEPSAARLILRGEAEHARAIGAAFGVLLPTQVTKSTASAGRAILCLGPDEWLLIASRSCPREIASILEPALSAIPHSLVDISHRQIALALTGRLAARVLNSGCPLDLSLSAFEVGAVVRTFFHKAEIVLWRKDTSTFHVEVWRSFAEYVAGHISVALRCCADLSERADQ